MMFIGGKWRGSPEKKRFAVKNPANIEEVVGSYEVGNRQTARQALEAAQAIQKTWQNTPPRQRAHYLNRINHLLLDNKEQLATILTMENGKPVRESVGEVTAAAAHFEWFAEEGSRTYGRIIPQTNSAKRHLVMATVSPWNFPLVLFARKVAPALAAGCAVVARPASQTTLVAIAAMKLIETTGLPQGV
ncbi:MAG: aldehyde dehydrogenase family protein, partial [Planctomycetota bacterium]